jgi:collagenase-like PrtC family protease
MSMQLSITSCMPSANAHAPAAAAAVCDDGVSQDVGAVSLIRRVAPQLAIHGSTQMSITSAEGAEFAAGEQAAADECQTRLFK